MNQSQRNLVQTSIDVYFQLDMPQLVATAYPNADESQAVIGEYTAKEFLSLSNKVFNQFREELKGSYIKALPFQYQFHNEFGGADLNTDLSNYVEYVSSNRLPNSVAHLARLIHYQACNGFWEKSKRKYFRHSEETANEEKERILLVSKQLEVAADGLKGLLENIRNSQEGLEQFLAAKSKELSEIESLLGGARTNSAEINKLHSISTATNEKIAAILSVAEDKSKEHEVLYKKTESEIDEVKGTLQSQLREAAKQNKEYEGLKGRFEEKVRVVESKTEYFSERNGYLDDLIGREVGASLFETFKQRKGELNSSISFWKWSVPVTAIATVIWIFFLFGNGDLGNISWQVIFVNSLKALPAIGILLFSISQYTKERNFQEEYAFKSAVALTINSYAGQLSAEENKDKLIMESVNAIYKTPIDTRNSKDAESKSLAETAKELTDVVKLMEPKK